MRRSVMVMPALALVLIGCAPPSGLSTAAAPLRTVQARIVSVTEIGLFTGDVEEVGYSYRFEPLDPRAQAFTAIGRTACPDSPDPDQPYQLTLRREAMVVALRAGQDESLASDLALVSCTRVAV